MRLSIFALFSLAVGSTAFGAVGLVKNPAPAPIRTPITPNKSTGFTQNHEPAKRRPPSTLNRPVRPSVPVMVGTLPPPAEGASQGTSSNTSSATSTGIPAADEAQAIPAEALESAGPQPAGEKEN